MSDILFVATIVFVGIALLTGFIVLIVLVGHVLGPFVGSKNLDSDDPEEQRKAIMRLAVATLVVIGLFRGFNWLLGQFTR